MKLVIFRGAGEMASACAHRLSLAGYGVMMFDLPQPLAVRREVCFAQAVYAGSHSVEGVRCRREEDVDRALALCRDQVSVLTQPLDVELLSRLRPHALVDGIMAKVNRHTAITDAPVVIGLGPGFTAGWDVDAVVETQRGHHLGRVYYQGSALADTGTPGEICGHTWERVVRAAKGGVFTSRLAIGDAVRAGDEFGRLDGEPVEAGVAGVVRGLLHPGLAVAAGTKLGDVDPRGRREYCYTISDKARAVAGGVLEALLHLEQKR